MDTQMVLTHTGKIYFNRSLGLEFLTVGDYGKENNIKADFLGLTKKIEGVQHHDVDLMDKWVATISSQKGCPMKCTFCDAVIEKNNGKKRCQAVFTPKRFMPLLDYDKVLDKLNELVEAVNRLEEKMAKADHDDRGE